MMAAGLTVVALAAGAGGAPQAGAAASGARHIRLDAARPGVPPHGSRDESLRLARREIALIVLPHGTRRLPQHPVPRRLRQPSLIPAIHDTVDIYRLFALRGAMNRSFRFLRTHPPAGMTVQATGSSSDRRHVVDERDVTFAPRQLPGGIYSLQLTVEIVPARHGRSLMRADVQVIWYPPRSAAEHLTAANFRAVKITSFSYDKKPRTVTRTLTGRTSIARLARLLNGLRAAPGVVVPCPISATSFRLVFEPVAGHSRVTVDTTTCVSDTIRVGGVAQPALADYGKVDQLADRLLRAQRRTLA